jgi:hypothetical protein
MSKSGDAMFLKVVKRMRVDAERGAMQRIQHATRLHEILQSDKPIKFTFKGNGWKHDQCDQ